jgi:hypothetical protein
MRKIVALRNGFTGFISDDKPQTMYVMFPQAWIDAGVWIQKLNREKYVRDKLRALRKYRTKFYLFKLHLWRLFR